MFSLQPNDSLLLDDSYGKMNVLWVCGVLRLDNDDNKPSGSGQEASGYNAKVEVFDAWPSKEGNERTEHAKRLFGKYEEIYNSQDRALPPKWWEYDSDASTELILASESSEEG